MRSGTWRGVAFAFALISAISTGSARADLFHHTIPREVDAVDVNTGGPYYAPPIPYGCYAKDNPLAGPLGSLYGGIGMLKGLVSGCHTCGACRRQRLRQLRRHGHGLRERTRLRPVPPRRWLRRPLPCLRRRRLRVLQGSRTAPRGLRQSPWARWDRWTPRGERVRRHADQSPGSRLDPVHPVVAPIDVHRGAVRRPRLPAQEPPFPPDRPRVQRLRRQGVRDLP